MGYQRLLKKKEMKERGIPEFQKPMSPKVQCNEVPSQECLNKPLSSE